MNLFTPDPASPSYVIFHDDNASVRTAVAAMRLLASGLGLGLTWRGRLFRFDLVEDETCREEALAAVRQADWILLSSSFPRLSGFALEHWCERCREAKSPGAVIVALAGTKECWDLSIEHLGDVYHASGSHHAPAELSALAG